MWLQTASEHVAIMADDEDRRGIALQIVDQPERSLEIEVVGRLVEQQEVGLGEQHGGKRHAHPPAAGERGKRPRLRVEVEAETGEDPGRARRCRMRVDVDEPRVNVGDALRIPGGLRLLQQGRALGVGGQHEVDQRAGAARRLLLDTAHLHLLRDRQRAEVRLHLVRDHLEERGLAGPHCGRRSRCARLPAARRTPCRTGRAVRAAG